MWQIDASLATYTKTDEEFLLLLSRDRVGEDFSSRTFKEPRSQCGSVLSDFLLTWVCVFREGSSVKKIKTKSIFLKSHQKLSLRETKRRGVCL